MDSTLHYTSVSHAGTLMGTINKMRVNSDLCDVTVVVGEYRIMAHKIILSASAPFFYQMLQLHSQSQPHGQNQSEVQLDNIDEIAALKIIEFCYTSAISLDDETVRPLLAASIKFQLPEICSFCCEFLVAGLDPSNCVLSLRLAAKVHCPQLEESCVRFLLENLEQVCVSHGLVSLPSQDLCSLLSVLALHDVGPATMAQLVGVWMEEDWPGRQDKVFMQLLQVFPNMAQYLHRLIQQSPHLRLKNRDNDKMSPNTEDCKLKDGVDKPKVNGENILTGSSCQAGHLDTNTGSPSQCKNNILENSRQDQEACLEDVEESSKLKGGSSVFGVGASREFICISCGDDFDCEEDLVSHQYECDESARMVGSVNGESIRAGLGKKSVDGDFDESSGKVCSEKDKVSKDERNECSPNSCGLNEAKCNENIPSNGESKTEKVMSTGDIAEEKSVDMSGLIKDKTGNGIEGRSHSVSKRSSRKRLKGIDKGKESVEKTEQQLKVSPAKRGRGEDEEGENIGNETVVESSCTNDDNNNDINSSDDEQGREDKNDLRTNHSSVPRPDLLANLVSHSSDKNGTTSDLSPKENHFKTEKLSNIYRWQEKSKYASSSLANVTSKPTSLQHQKPPNKCQLCGKAFWEKKHLSQHWLLDHGVKGKSTEDDEQDSYQLCKSDGLKFSPSKEIQTDLMTLSTSNHWPFSNHLGYFSVDSMFKSDSVLRNRDGLNEDLKSKLQNEVDKKMFLDLSKEHDVKNVLSDKNLLNIGLKPENFAYSNKESSPTSSLLGASVKGDNPRKKGNNVTDVNVSLPPGTFTLPGQSLAASNDPFTDYLKYNAFAQWCMSQGPNFCRACLVYHTDGNPCPRSVNSMTGEKSYVMKTEKKEVKKEVDGEEKEVNVDKLDEEMEDGPLDMSKTALDFSTALSSSSSTSSSPHFVLGLPSGLGIPPYYSYAHYMPGGSILDMSAAAATALKVGNSEVSSQPRIQDMASVLSGSSHFGRGETAFNSYHPFSTAIPTSSSVSNGNLTHAIPSSENNLNSVVATSSNSNNNISSSSPPSSSFTFRSSSPNLSSLTSPSGGKKKPVPPKQGFPCNVCNRVYSHQSALLTHMRSHSPSSRSYRCQFCNETFARAPDLKVHICPNGIEKPFTCPSCGQTFAKNIHLKRHLATHSGLKPYPCWICGKRFSRSDHLKRHTQSIHAGARPHACHICGKEFVRKYELNKHMASHNG